MIIKVKEDVDLATLMDLGGVLFENNPNPKEVYAKIMNLYGGKDIENMAKYFNLEEELEIIKKSEYYQSRPAKIAPYVAGELLLDKLLESGEIDKETLIKARIDAVRKREDNIISSLIESYPTMDFAIATQDGQIIHEVVNHYFPELEEKYQIVATDSDINAHKATPEFYYNAEKRLSVPTSKMLLIDDSKKDIESIEAAGGIGALYNSNENESLEDFVRESIEKSRGR